MSTNYKRKICHGLAEVTNEIQKHESFGLRSHQETIGFLMRYLCVS